MATLTYVPSLLLLPLESAAVTLGKERNAVTGSEDATGPTGSGRGLSHLERSEFVRRERASHPADRGAFFPENDHLLNYPSRVFSIMNDVVTGAAGLPRNR